MSAAVLPPNVAKRVRTEGDCVLWLGACNNRGYGTVGVGNKKTALVHRVVYQATVGDIPADLTIDHLCRNKTCVNVEHMDVVTRAENSRRAHESRYQDKLAQLGYTPPIAGGPSFSDIFEKYFGNRTTV
jgi:hypothetical protein